MPSDDRNSPKPKIRKHAFSEIDQTPTGPGLYAWYAITTIGRRDWEPDVNDKGADKGRENLRRLLAKHTCRFAGAELHITAKSSFEKKWHGKLISDESIGGDLTKWVPPDVLSDPKLRGAFSNALSATTPQLAAPLYIGKAICLNTRLRYHRDKISRLQRRRSDEQIPNPKEFAERAVNLGFNDSTLEVYTWDLSEFSNEGFSNAQLESVALAIETLLNRWHRPLLGRS